MAANQGDNYTSAFIVCNACEKHLPPDNFYSVNRKTCKKCKIRKSKNWKTDNRDRVNAWSRGHAKTPKRQTYKKFVTIKYRYGISLEEYKAMEARQCMRCAICNSSPSETFHIDHCHKTGVVRGLLCGACNRGIGAFYDNPENLEAAARYLRIHNGK